jgi:hypothetical protein
MGFGQLPIHIQMRFVVAAEVMLESLMPVVQNAEVEEVAEVVEETVVECDNAVPVYGIVEDAVFAHGEASVSQVEVVRMVEHVEHVSTMVSALACGAHY